MTLIKKSKNSLCAIILILTLLLISTIPSAAAVKFETGYEANEWLQTIINSMGITEEQYWDEFAPKYHALVLGIKYNVNQYCKENNLPEITGDDIKCNILNTEIKNEIREESEK